MRRGHGPTLRLAATPTFFAAAGLALGAAVFLVAVVFLGAVAFLVAVAFFALAAFLAGVFCTSQGAACKSEQT